MRDRAPHRGRRRDHNSAHRPLASASAPAPDRQRSLSSYIINNHVCRRNTIGAEHRQFPAAGHPRRCSSSGGIVSKIPTGRGHHRHPRQPARAAGGPSGSRTGSSSSSAAGTSSAMAHIPTRSARSSQARHPTIYGNYDYAIARDEEDCGCAYVTPHDRELGSSRSPGRSRTQARHPRLYVRPAFRLRFRVGDATCTWSTAPRGKSTSTCSRTSRHVSLNVSPPPSAIPSSSSATPTNRGLTSTAGCCCQLWLGRQAQGRRPTRRLRRAHGTADSVDVSIERVDYDADAVAAAVHEAGLPHQFADKLMMAA